MAGYLETVLIQEQRQAENLTTFEVYPFPPRLREIFYPLDFRGDPMAPELLVMHSRSHMFNMPRCFHGRDARLVFGRNGRAFLLCGEEGCCPACDMVSDLVRVVYNQCLPLAETGFEGPSTSSGGSSTPDSLPSLASSPPSEDQRMPDVFDGPRGGLRGFSQRVDIGFPGVVGNEQTPLSTPKTLFHVSGVRGDLTSLPSQENMQQASAGSMSVVRPHNGSFYWMDGDACMRGREDVDSVTFHDSLRCSSNSLIPGPSEWTNGRVTAPGAAHPFRFSMVKPPPRREGRLEDLCDEDNFPLLARPDGTSSLTSCLDPVTRDFSDELFLSQIVKDSVDNDIKY
ncbi:hypothetical protein CVT26_004896 [Gymnopilus dilepis]|uniref:Uncharacterized protein n=1 Tax=Gymnopilus dilepis TaxID=231916 RepID=A0A409YIX8_9AGAR|nr:hypothetical protein CVT26_004896 [Gymnopilus dilepis]